jgi:hypothetical protein
MFPDLGEDINDLLRNVASDLKNVNDGMEVVPTFVPASSINSEIEFELEHNLTNRSAGRRRLGYGQARPSQLRRYQERKAAAGCGLRASHANEPACSTPDRV